MESGCKVCQKYMEHYAKEHHSENNARFYSVMEVDFSRYIIIPKEFTEQLKGKLSETVELKDQSGNIWHVGLREIKGETLLRSGWRKFVEAQHIQEKDLLVFKYEGNSCFRISIFDESGCKKVTPHSLDKNSLVKEGMVEDSVGVLKVGSGHKVRKVAIVEDSAEPALVPRKVSGQDKNVGANDQMVESNGKRKTVKATEVSAHERNKNGEPYSGKADVASSGTIKIKQESPDSQEIVGMPRLAEFPNLYLSRKRTAEDEKKALLMARKVQSSNPCFVTFITPSNLCKASSLCVPSSFAAAHLSSQKMEITLKIPDQRKEWCVAYLGTKSKLKICKNWKSFVKDNSLENGDACLFELTKKDKDVAVMKVYINN